MTDVLGIVFQGSKKKKVFHSSTSWHSSFCRTQKTRNVPQVVHTLWKWMRTEADQKSTDSNLICIHSNADHAALDFDVCDVCIKTHFHVWIAL